MTEKEKTWPECVGKDANEVEKQLKTEGILIYYKNIDIKIWILLDYEPEILPEGSPTTRDYCANRVRLFVDNNNKIVSKPATG